MKKVCSRPVQNSSSRKQGYSVSNTAINLTNNHRLGINVGGNCTPNELRRLQEDVDNYCKGQGSSCKSGMSDYDLKINIETARKCALARNKVNSKCFAGGDSGHKKAEQQAWNNVVKCETRLNEYFNRN